VIIIGAMLSPANVALFSIAQKIPEGFLKLFSSFIIVYFPSLSRLFSKDKNKDAEILINNSLMTFSIGIIFLFLISFMFGDQIIRLVFSDNYLEIALAFALLMLNFYFRAISNVMGYSLVAAGHSSIPPKVNFISCLINIVGSLIMIQKFGYIGAVYSLLIKNIVSLSIYYICLERFKIHNNINNILLPLISGFIIVTMHHFAEVEIGLVKVIFLGTYLFFCYLTLKDFRNILPILLKKFQKLSY
jgi:O-antigen/teichoic acid export membrane protein